MNIENLKLQALIYGALYDFCEHLQAKRNPDAMSGLSGFARLRSLPIFEIPIINWVRQFNDAQAPEEWTGEGLPPVGTVCERNIARSAWCETTILAHSVGSRVCAGFQDMAGQLGWSGDVGMFRPIRTPEQIAAEERADEIDSLTSTLLRIGRETSQPNSLCGAHEISRALYAAGYRKQVKP